MNESELREQILLPVKKVHFPTEKKDGKGIIYTACAGCYIDCHSRSGLMCNEYCDTYLPYPCGILKLLGE